MVKLLLTDVDGVLTDGSMYYLESGDEMKRFHTYDGMAFELLRNSGIKTGILTSETTELVKRRAAKMKADYLYQGVKGKQKLEAAITICTIEKINLNNVAYIGDDINCVELLRAVGYPACPANAVIGVREIPGIIHLKTTGGYGVIREFVEKMIYTPK